MRLTSGERTLLCGDLAIGAIVYQINFESGLHPYTVSMKDKWLQAYAVCTYLGMYRESQKDLWLTSQ